MRKALAGLMVVLWFPTSAMAAVGDSVGDGWTIVGYIQGWPCISKDAVTAYCGPIVGDRMPEVRAVCINRQCQAASSGVDWNAVILQGTGAMLRSMQQQQEEQRRQQQQRPPSWRCSTVGSFTDCTPF